MRSLPRLLLLLTLLATLPALAQATDEEESAPSWEGYDGEFSAMLAVTAYAEEFYEQWNKPASPDYRPHLKTASRVHRGDTVTALVFFMRCAVNEVGNCRVEGDFRILKPDGSVYADEKGLDVWRDLPYPDEGFVQLSHTNLGLLVEPDDPLGTYRFEVVVRDLLAEREIRLYQDLDVVADDEQADRDPPPYRATPTLDSDAFMQGYYQEPAPDVIPTFIRVVGGNPQFLDGESSPPLVAFLAVVFADNPDSLDGWQSVIAEMPAEAREVLGQAVVLAEDPKGAILSSPPSPTTNDMCWGAFFASGDVDYVHELIDRVRHVEEREDRNLFLAGASAQWSLCGNARRHALVRDTVEKVRDGSENPMSEFMRDIQEKDPGEFREATIAIVREQHDKGVW